MVKFIALNIITFLLLLAMLLTSLFNSNEKQYSNIQLTSHFKCYPSHTNAKELDQFQMDTIELYTQNTDRKFYNRIHEVTYSNNSDRGFFIKLNNTKYKDFIRMLDFFLRNNITSIRTGDDCIYYFPSKLPIQMYFLQEIRINSEF
jgi:hypothetical protein